MCPTQSKSADFELYPREETVSINGAPLKIKRRAFQVLQLLVENAGKVVAKEEFFQTVWRGAFVEENNLTVAVAQIRRALGETAETKFIETVPRKGYRFVAAVERVFDEAECSVAEKDVGAAGSSYPREPTANSEVERDDPAEQPATKATPGVFAVLASRKILVFAGLGSIIFIIGAFWRIAAPVPSESLRSVAVNQIRTRVQKLARRRAVPSYRSANELPVVNCQGDLHGGGLLNQVQSRNFETGDRLRFFAPGARKRCSIAKELVAIPVQFGVAVFAGPPAR